jgi:aspartyl-tRNA synthetase
MHRYRSHHCDALREGDIGQTVRLAGWCHRIRDHGGLLFIDLRDHYGMTQCVADPDSPAFKEIEKLRSEWVVRVEGKVRKRPALPLSCRCQCLASTIIRRKSGSSTGSSTCAASICIRTS